MSLAIWIRRLAERARRVPLRTAVPLLVASLVVVAAGTVGVARSPLFSLRHLRIVAGPTIDAEEIRRLAGVTAGDNMLWLDTGAVQGRLEANPWIASADVTRTLPWTVTIRVEERTPIAVVDDGSGRTLVAGDGTMLGAAVGTPGLPRISLPRATPTTVGIPDPDGAVRALATLPPSMRKKVRAVEVSIEGSLTLHLSDGVTVDYGAPVEGADKAIALRKVLRWAAGAGQRLRAISVVAPDAPAATLAR